MEIFVHEKMVTVNNDDKQQRNKERCQKLP